MSYSPPVGWMIDSELIFDGYNDFEEVWRVYKYCTWTEKKRWSRKPVEHTGWRNVFSTRHKSDAEAWLKATVKAIEAEREK